MINQRLGLAALRLGACKPSMIINQNTARMALAASMSTTQSRQIATTKLSNEAGQEILVQQRLSRPLAPHLTVYKLNQTWFSASAWTRITGCTLSGASYLYFTTYLAAPLLGWHLETMSLVSTFAAMPFLLKGGIKFGLAFPFVFHFINGTRHLISLDVGKGFSKPVIKRAEIFLWSASALGGLYLAFGM